MWRSSIDGAEFPSVQMHRIKRSPCIPAHGIMLLPHNMYVYEKKATDQSLGHSLHSHCCPPPNHHSGLVPCCCPGNIRKEAASSNKRMHMCIPAANCSYWWKVFEIVKLIAFHFFHWRRGCVFVLALPLFHLLSAVTQNTVHNTVNKTSSLLAPLLHLSTCSLGRGDRRVTQDVRRQFVFHVQQV